MQVAGLHFFKRKFWFEEHNISRIEDFLGVEVKNSPSFLTIQISKKHTSYTSRCKFISSVTLVMCKTETTESSQVMNWWRSIVQFFKRCLSIQNRGRCLLIKYGAVRMQSPQYSKSSEAWNLIERATSKCVCVSVLLSRSVVEFPHMMSRGGSL